MKLGYIIPLLLACLMTSCTRAPSNATEAKPAPVVQSAADKAEQPTAATATADPTELTFDGHKLSVPAGKSVTIKSTKEELDGGGFEKHEGTASGKGAGLNSAFEKAVVDFNASAPIANILGFGSSSGGSTDLSASFMGKGGSPILAWLGGLMILGGVAAIVWKKRIMDGLVLCFAGGVCVWASTLGTLGLFIVLLLLGAVLAYFWWKSHQGTAAAEALRAVIAGVEDLPTHERAMAKAKVKAHADAADVKTIAKFKTKDGLPSER